MGSLRARTKVAGFVHKSFQREKNWVILDFFVCETNPRIKFFENRITKQIRELNLLKTASRNKTANGIFWKPHHELNLGVKSFENWQIGLKRIHGHMIPWYDSCNLSQNTSDPNKRMIPLTKLFFQWIGHFSSWWDLLKMSKSDSIIRLIPLSEIPLSGAQCTNT